MNIERIYGGPPEWRAVTILPVLQPTTTTVTLATSSLQYTVQNCYTDVSHLQPYLLQPISVTLSVSLLLTLSLRSTTSGQWSCCCTSYTTFSRLDDWAFSVAGQKIWNNLPTSLWQTTLKRQLKPIFSVVYSKVNLCHFYYLFWCILPFSTSLYLCLLQGWKRWFFKVLVFYGF